MLLRTPRRALQSAAVLEVFFDFSSPFAYLGMARAPSLAREHAAPLVLRPMLLGGLFRAIGTPLVPIAEMSEAKRRYVLLDMQRWARHRGVPLQWPSRFPLRTVDALRLVLLADEATREPLVQRIMRLCWVEDGDPADRESLRRCAVESGVDPALLGRLESAKDALRRATDDAARRGVPGVPTFFVGGSMFFGQDRLQFVAAALAGRFEEPRGVSEERERGLEPL